MTTRLLPEVRARLHEDYAKTDRFVLILLLLHALVAATIMPIGYGNALLGVVGGGVIFGIALLAYLFLRGTLFFRAIAGIALMSFSALFIQQHLGQIEMHFHIFVALAFLLIYRDWIAIVTPAAVIAVHHLLFNALQQNSVMFGDTPIMIFSYGCGWDTVFLHAIFVVVEAAVLIV